MRRRTVLGLAASCLLAACAHQTPAPDPSGMAWTLNETPSEGVKLAYGLPDSDMVLVMMTCRPSSGDVVLLQAVGPDAPAAIALASGAAEARFAGEASPSMGDGAFVEAMARADDPALARFARTGDLALRDGGRTHALPASSADRDRIAAFFRSCRAA
jgi:hypothetical protein